MTVNISGAATSSTQPTKFSYGDDDETPSFLSTSRFLCLFRLTRLQRAHFRKFFSGSCLLAFSPPVDREDLVRQIGGVGGVATGGGGREEEEQVESVERKNI